MKYAVISMAFVRLDAPTMAAEGPYLPKGYTGIWPETEDGVMAMLRVLMPHFEAPPANPGIWIRRFKLKLDGGKISVLWARWKEATLEEARELQNVMESEP